MGPVQGWDLLLLTLGGSGRVGSALWALQTLAEPETQSTGHKQSAKSSVPMEVPGKQASRSRPHSAENCLFSLSVCRSSMADPCPCFLSPGNLLI